MNATERHEPLRRIATPGPFSLKRWREDRDWSSTTVWRYRRKGWLRTINIAGKPYLTQEAIADFERRAAAGEFSRAPRGAAARAK